MTAFLRFASKNLPWISRGATAVFGVLIFFFAPYAKNEEFHIQNQIIQREIAASKTMPVKLRYEVMQHLRKVEKLTTWEFEFSGVRTNSTQLLGAIIVIAGVCAVFILHYIDMKVGLSKR